MGDGALTTTISFEEACSLIKCTPETLSEKLRTGELPGVKFGREWVIPRDAFCMRLNEMAITESRLRREAQHRASADVVSISKPSNEKRRRPLINVSND